MAESDARLVITAVDQTKQAFESVKRSLEGVNKGIALVGKAAGFGFLGHEVKELAASFLEAGIKFERSQTLLQATLKATDSAAGLTLESLNRLAHEMSEGSNFDPEAFKDAESALLRFRNLNKETFEEAVKLAADYAAATGRSLPDAAATIGRASQGEARDLKALAEATSHFSQKTRDTIDRLREQGRTAEVTRLVFEELRKSFEGVDRAQHTGITGGLKDLTTAWEDFKQSLATSPAVLTIIVGGLQLLTGAIRDLQAVLDAFSADKADEKLKKLGHSNFIKTLPIIGPAAQAADFLRQRFGPEVVEPTDPAVLADRRKALQKQDENASKLKADQAYVNQQRAIRANVVRAKEAAEEINRDVAQSAGIQNAVLEDAYERGELDLVTYLNARKSIFVQGLQREIEGIDKTIKAEQELLGANSTPQEQKPEIQKSIDAGKAQQRRLRQQIDNAAITTDEELVKKQNELLVGRNELDAKIAEQEGRLAAAGRIRLGIESRRLDVELRQLGVPAVDRKKLIDTYVLEANAINKVGEAARNAELIKQQLANDERDIASAVEKGELTEQQAIYKTDEARRASVALLEKQLAAEEAAAAASPKVSEETLQSIRNLRSEIKALEASAHQAEKQMRDLLVSSLTQPIVDFVNHTKSAKDAFRDFVKAVTDGLTQIAAKEFATSLFGGKTAGGGSTAGVFSGAAPFLANLFNPTGGAAATQAATTQAASVEAANFTAAGAAGFAMGGIMTPHGALELKRYASGGIANAPQLALFGEGRQNEAYVPLPDGRRIPVNMKGGSGGNVTQHLTVNIAATDVASFQRSERQVITTLAVASRRALNRR